MYVMQVKISLLQRITRVRKQVYQSVISFSLLGYILFEQVMSRRIFYAQIQAAARTGNTIYVVYDLTYNLFRFNKNIKKLFVDFAGQVENLLILRQKSILQMEGITHLQNEEFIIHNFGEYITIVTKYIPSLNLIELHRQLTCALQPPTHIFELPSLAKKLIRLLIGSRYLIPSFQNVLIDRNQKIYLNHASTVGWRLLLFEQQISREEFKEICMFVDKQVFQRQIHQRIDFRVKVRSLAIILLGFTAQEIFNLPNKLQIPTNVDKQTAIKLLQQLDRLMHKFLQITRIRQKIEAKQQEWGIQLSLFLQVTLAPSQSVNLIPLQCWSQILRLLFSHKTDNIQTLRFLSEVAKNSWNSLHSHQQTHYTSNALIPPKQAQSEWHHEQIQIFLTELLNQKLQKGWLVDRIHRQEFTSDSHTLNSKLQNLLAGQHQLIKLQKCWRTNKQGRFTMDEVDRSHYNSVVLAQRKLHREFSVRVKEKGKEKGEVSRSMVVRDERLLAIDRFRSVVFGDEY